VLFLDVFDRKRSVVESVPKPYGVVVTCATQEKSMFLVFYV
jgi:hypothetical protein